MIEADDGRSSGDRMDATGRRVTRTADTLARYRTIQLSIVRQAAVALGQEAISLDAAIRWFEGGHGRWSASTIRIYAAALTQALADAGRAPAIDRFDAGQPALARPHPREGGPKRTSARKRRSCPYAEIASVRAALLERDGESPHPDDRLLAKLLFHGCLLGLRPCEWASARVVGARLIVRNAKTSNNRACGPEREIDLLGPYEDPIVRWDLADLIGAMARLPVEETGRRRAFGRLAARLNRACRRAGVARISLYTPRHIALSSAKRVMTPAEVAALAGHAVDRTAAQHYAKRRTGWRRKAIPARPTGDTVARVRVSGRIRRSDPTPGHTR